MFATVPRMLSFKNFEEAFNIYKSFVKDTEETASKEDEKKRELRNLLCSRQNGLCIYLIRMQNYELILLRSDDICLDSFLSLVVNNEVVNADNSDVVGKEFCQDLVSVLDTEWDRRVFRVFAACGRSNSEFTALGFKSDLRNSDRTKVESVINETKKLDEEAEKLEMEGLESKKGETRRKGKEIESDNGRKAA